MQAHNLVLHDGNLTTSENHIFVPAEPEHLRARMMVISHAGVAGHRGQKVTLRDLALRFVWPKMAEQVRQFVKRCLLCCKTRGGGQWFLLLRVRHFGALRPEYVCKKKEEL